MTRYLSQILIVGAISSVFVSKSFSQSISIYADTSIGQVKFAVSDIQAALTKKGQNTQIFPTTALNASSTGEKIVLGLSSNTGLTGVLTSLGGALPPVLGEQAYCLKTTTQGQKVFWILGGDFNGTMYGGLQLAENIFTDGFAGSYETKESPSIPRRGIKLNLPMDLVAETYGTSNTAAKANAIPNVWDMSFWTAWFDDMARNRYNVLSVWSNHPFTSMIKMSEYPDVAIQGVKGLDGKVVNTMSIDEKIVFWKKVMAYAKSRGFYFYLFNWNLWTDNATGKYGITESVTNATTIKYMRKCMSTLWETYPDLDGFGITQGENMSDNEQEDALFLANTFGLGTVDYIKNNPTKKVKFIHRWHMADFPTIKKNFAELFKYPDNISFEMSFKYSLAHMYSAALPQRMDQKEEIEPLIAAGLKTNFTVRNDDFYHHNWGDPEFARAYVNGMISKGNWFAGFYMGSDGFSQTRTFFSKNPQTKTTLHIQHQWYMFMLWGRLSYNPNTANSVFKNILAVKYPGVSSEALFTAWQRASRSLPTVGDLITGSFGRDDQWYPEACQADINKNPPSGFLRIEDFATTSPSKGSALASIAVSATGSLGGKKSSYAVADSIETDAKAALVFAYSLNPVANSELATALMHIKAMSFLSSYYAYKIRGATFNKGGKKPEATSAMSKAYCWWMNYSNLMDANYLGQDMARTSNIPSWHVHDESVLKEYTTLSGSAAKPNCEDIATDIVKQIKPSGLKISLQSFKINGLVFNMPEEGEASISIFNLAGIVVFQKSINASKGRNEIRFANKLGLGLHFVQISSAKLASTGKMRLASFE